MNKKSFKKMGSIALVGALTSGLLFSGVYATNNEFCNQNTHEFKDNNGDFICDICGGGLMDLPSGADILDSLLKGRTEEDYIPNIEPKAKAMAYSVLKEYPYENDNGVHDNKTHKFEDNDEDGLCDLCGGEDLADLPPGSDLGDSLGKGGHDEDVIPSINTQTTEESSSELPDFSPDANIDDELHKGDDKTEDAIPDISGGGIDKTENTETTEEISETESSETSEEETTPTEITSTETTTESTEISTPEDTEITTSESSSEKSTTVSTSDSEKSTSNEIVQTGDISYPSIGSIFMAISLAILSIFGLASLKFKK